MTPSALQAARKAAGMTVGAVAQAVGVDRTTIGRWERGDGVPGDVYLQRLRRVLWVGGAVTPFDLSRVSTAELLAEVVRRLKLTSSPA